MTYLNFFKVIVLSLLCIGCQNDKMIGNFEVVRYSEVALDYQYSNDIIEYRGKRFKPILKEVYVNGILISASIYKSEGMLSYSKLDLEEDNSLVRYLGIKKNRVLLIRGNYLIDDTDELKIMDNSNQKYYCFNKKQLITYFLVNDEEIDID